MTPQRIETPEHVSLGLRELGRLDPRLAAILAKVGDVPLRRQPPGFAGLAHIIVGQMVSRASADAIWTRLLARTGPLTPQAVLELDEAACRAIGLSRAKESTLRRAATACRDRTIDLDHLCTLPPGEAIAAMTAIKGVGPWTAEVYLLFCAGHADIFPAGDIALQNAARHGLALEARPDAKALRTIAERWQPWRGVAARLLWAYYSAVMRREVAPEPV